MNEIKTQINLKSIPPISGVREQSAIEVESDMDSRPTVKMPEAVKSYLVSLTATRTYLVSKTMGEWRGQAKSIHHALVLSYKSGVRGHVNYIDDTV